MAADKTVERRFDAGRFNSVRAVFVAFGRFLNSCNFSGIGKIQRLQIKNLRRNLQTIFRYIHKRFNCSCWSDSPQPSSLPLSPRCGLRQASASERPMCCYLKCADRRGGRESVVFQEPEEQERRNTLVAVAERAVLDRRVGRIGRLFPRRSDRDSDRLGFRNILRNQDIGEQADGQFPFLRLLGFCLVMDGMILYKVFVQHFVRPDTELRGVSGVDTITYRWNHIEVVIWNHTPHLP